MNIKASNEIRNSKPCPFCGSEEIVIMWDSGGRRAGCKRCFSSARLGVDEEDATIAWNSRYHSIDTNSLANTNKSFVDNLKRLRKIRGLSRQALAEQMNGFNKSNGNEITTELIEKLEDGIDKPDCKILQLLVLILGVDSNWLIGVSK